MLDSLKNFGIISRLWRVFYAKYGFRHILILLTLTSTEKQTTIQTFAKDYVVYINVRFVTPRLNINLVDSYYKEYVRKHKNERRLQEYGKKTVKCADDKQFG